MVILGWLNGEWKVKEAFGHDQSDLMRLEILGKSMYSSDSNLNYSD